MTLSMITRTVAVSALATIALSLGACGSSDDTTSAGAAPTGTTAAAAPTTADDQGCGGDAVDTVKKAVTSDAVKKIQVIGGCHEVSIETSLGPDAKADGEKLCDAAAKVAYDDQISSITVSGADGHELAAGIKGMPCI
jgi:hypothetical protein